MRLGWTFTQVNEQIQMYDIMVKKGCHVDASIPQSPRKPETKAADIQSGTHIHADKAYSSQKHRAVLKSCSINNGIQDKVAKNSPLMHPQLQRNNLIAKIRYVVERTFDIQARWFNAKILRYRSLAKTHAQYTLLAMAYNLKRLPNSSSIGD